MFLTKVGRHGQITIPRQIRRKLNLHEGDHIAISIEGDTIVLRPITQTLLDLRGSVPVAEVQDFSAIRQQVIHDQARKVVQDETGASHEQNVTHL
jgi:AbrB family looped-hinge helix DNA binding protein